MSGRVIAGRYRLDDPIGRGAMGVVWRARDELLDRDVAVKEVLISEALSDDERENAYQRTLREARTAARLSHRGVVAIYDVAEDDGRPWIVMELVPAKSLEQILTENGPLSPRRAGQMGQQLLAALATAHAAGVLHRDVKPSNVLLGSDGRAVLTDFGIATFQGDPRLTQTGMVMGSPGYTAPERIRGGPATPASDLWSLGATLFTAVEGHGPFEKRGGAITTMSAIIHEDPPPPSAAGPLSGVILALLRRDPAGRPDAQTAGRLMASMMPVLPEDRRPDTVVSSVISSPVAADVSVASAAPSAVPVTTPSGARSGGAGDSGGGARPDTVVNASAPPVEEREAASPPEAGTWAQRPGGEPSTWNTARPAPQRRRLRVTLSALAVLVAAAAGAGAALALRHHPAAPPRAGASSDPTVPVIVQPRSEPLTALNTPVTTLPAGYAPFSVSPTAAGSIAGFSVGVPPGWTTVHSEAVRWLVNSPVSGGYLLIDLTPHTLPDMFQEALFIRNVELRQKQRPGYHQIALSRAVIRDTAGAIWEFTWNDAGVRMHAEDLLFTKDGQSYAVYLTAPQLLWAKLLPSFDQTLSTFHIITTG
jgi:serine/threonine protein kinase